MRVKPLDVHSLAPAQVPECDDMLLEWMREMAAYLKTLDPNHLITSGGEGFFGANSPRANSNPQVCTRPYP